MQKNVKNKSNKVMIAAAVILAVIVVVLVILLILEGGGVLYRADDDTVTITPPKRADLERHTDGDYQYALLKDGTVIILGYTGTAGETLEISSSLGGKTVTAIEESAFALSLLNTKAVIVPEGVTYIGKMAFFGAENATLYLPSTIEQIANQATYGFDDPVAIYFAGTKKQWEKVKIGSGNKELVIVTCQK